MVDVLRSTACGRRTAAAASLATVTLLAATLAAQARPAQPPAAVNDTPARHLVWRVAKGPRTVAFLVGSVHVLTKAAYPLPAVFDGVFDSRRRWWRRWTSAPRQTPRRCCRCGERRIFTDGRTLGDRARRGTYSQVESQGSATGMPTGAVERMKPWLVAMSLAVPELQPGRLRSGVGPRPALLRARQGRRPAGARPRDRRLPDGAVDGLPMPVQVEMLRATLDDVDTQVAAVARSSLPGRRATLATLERLLLQAFRESPEVYQRLLVDRNRDWVPKIAQCAAEPSPCLVVVGGAHLRRPRQRRRAARARPASRVRAAVGTVS